MTCPRLHRSQMVTKRLKQDLMFLKPLRIVLCLPSLEAALTLLSHRDNISSSIISDFSK